MRETQESPLLRTMVEFRLNIFHTIITRIFYIQYLQIPGRRYKQLILFNTN
jgi:hypothetical protein